MVKSPFSFEVYHKAIIVFSRPLEEEELIDIAAWLEDGVAYMGALDADEKGFAGIVRDKETGDWLAVSLSKTALYIAVPPEDIKKLGFIGKKMVMELFSTFRIPATVSFKISNMHP